MQPYAPRAFRFIELLTIDPSAADTTWRMKLYGIASQGELPRASLLSAARRIAGEQLVREKANNYGVGFIGVHDGRDAAFVFVDFWGNENELFHRVFLSRGSDPDKLTPAEPADSSVCVWDLHLQSFERAAWIKHVLRKAEAPDFEGYLAEHLREDA
jgi:hypothetical protein